MSFFAGPNFKHHCHHVNLSPDFCTTYCPYYSYKCYFLRKVKFLTNTKLRGQETLHTECTLSLHQLPPFLLGLVKLYYDSSNIKGERLLTLRIQCICTKHRPINPITLEDINTSFYKWNGTSCRRHVFVFQYLLFCMFACSFM